jgi:hypothetical protein
MASAIGASGENKSGGFMAVIERTRNRRMLAFDRPDATKISPAPLHAMKFWNILLGSPR